MNSDLVASELVKIAKSLQAGKYYRLDDKHDQSRLWVISKSYNLGLMYKTVARGDDFPMERIKGLIRELEVLMSKVTEHTT